MAHQHNVPAPVVDAERMTLSRCAAANAAVLRAAQVEAESRGLKLEVEPIREAL